MSYTWKNAKYGILKLNYTCYYLRWYGLYKDDRAIYCNLYRQILDALESVVDDPAPLARVGLNNAIQDLQHPHSSQYCYTVYRGYKEETK